MKLRWTAPLMLAALACGGPADEETAARVEAAPPAAAVTERAVERVAFERITTAKLGATIAASGSIEAKRITELGSEVPGRIVSVLVEVGDDVDAGAPLFRIDADPYRLALREAEAGLALARAESANANEEAARLGTLLEQKAASQQRYDATRTRAEVAEAQVAQMAARVAKARRDLEQTEVRAPYDANIVERRAHEGAMAGQAPILVLQERGAFEAILDVPEATPVPVRAGDPVELFVEGLPDPLSAAVSRVSQRVDPGTRTYEVRAEVSDAGGRLKAGSYVRAELRVVRAEARPVVHRSALVLRDGRSLVLKVEDGRVRYAPVRVGLSADEQVELLDGVAPGDVVVRGEATSRLADGTRVEPSSDGARAANEHAEPTS